MQTLDPHRVNKLVNQLERTKERPPQPGDAEESLTLYSFDTRVSPSFLQPKAKKSESENPVADAIQLLDAAVEFGNPHIDAVKMLTDMVSSITSRLSDGDHLDDRVHIALLHSAMKAEKSSHSHAFDSLREALMDYQARIDEPEFGSLKSGAVQEFITDQVDANSITTAGYTTFENIGGTREDPLRSFRRVS